MCDLISIFDGQKYSEYKNCKIKIDNNSLIHVKYKVGNGSEREDILINCTIHCKNIKSVRNNNRYEEEI